MKIFDIISEAGPVDKEEMKRRRLRAADLNKKLNTPTPPAPTPAKKLDVSTPAAANARAAQIAQRYDAVKPTGPAGQLAKQLSKGRAMSEIWKDFSYEKMKDIAKTDKNIAARFTKWNDRVVTPVRWGMRAIGVLVIAYDYYTITGLLETAYQNQELTDEQFKKGIAAANGVLTAQLAVNLVSTLKNINIIRWIVRIIEAIVGVAGATVSFGASAAAALATDAFITWMTYWLGTNEGQRWLINSFLGPFIIGFGSVEASVWNTLTGYYSKQKTAQQDKADPAGAQARKEKAAASASDKEAGAALADKLVF